MYKYISTRSLCDEDWKTQAAQGYSNIPKGAEVQYLGMMNNLYGHYAEVRYNGRHYYVNPNGIKRIWVDDESKN